MFRRSLALVFVVALAACGSSDDSSGVSGSKKISELSNSELETVCTWAAELRGGENKVTECTEGTFDTGTIDNCVTMLSESGCNATVSATETCVEAMAPNPCESPMDLSACEPVTPCFTSSDDLPKTSASK